MSDAVPPAAGTPRASKEVTVALISAGSTIVVALIGAAVAIWTGVASVPALDGTPDLGALQEEAAELHDQVSALAAQVEDLKAENSELRSGTSDSPSVSPDTGDSSSTIVLERELLLTGGANDRVAAFDLDTDGEAEYRLTEWETPGGSAAAFDVGLHGWTELLFREPVAQASEADAPSSGAQCRAALEGTTYERRLIDDLTEGDVLCVASTDGRVARLAVLEAVPERGVIRFEVTVFG